VPKPKKPTVQKKPAQTPGPKAGNVRLVVQVRPDHVEGLVAEANRRREQRGGVRADTSAVVRDALDAYPPLKAKR
jgi:hypothetical protein